MPGQNEKSPLILADLASRRRIIIKPSIAQKPICDIVFDGDLATTSEACVALRHYFKISDFVGVCHD